MEVAEKGWVIISKLGAGAFKISSLFRFVIALNGGFSFANYLFAKPTYISRWIRIGLNISPCLKQHGHPGGLVPTCRKYAALEGKSFGEQG